MKNTRKKAQAAAAPINPIKHISECLPAQAYTTNEDRAIKRALKIIANKLREPGATCDSPWVTGDLIRGYFGLSIAASEREVFAVMFLDNQHRLIEVAELFQGTIDGASVYPREVVKAALSVNAAAVILAHNHPSGSPEPSEADKRITARITHALELVQVRVLDHIIVGGAITLSFAARGLL